MKMEWILWNAMFSVFMFISIHGTNGMRFCNDKLKRILAKMESDKKATINGVKR